MTVRTQKSRMLWSLCAPAYRNAVGWSISHKKMFTDVIRALNLKKGSRLLDAGCGAGDLEKYIHLRKLDYKIEGIDFSPSMVKGAKRKNPQTNFTFQVADLDEKLPYVDNFFDGIICIQALFALPRPEFAIKEFARVLKPNGKLVIVDPKVDSDMNKTIERHFKEIRKYKGNKKIKAYLNVFIRFPFGMIVLLFNRVMNKWAAQGYYRFFNVNELTKQLEKVGLKVKSINKTLADQDNLYIAIK